MAKYHIGKSGQPTICRAKNGNCPFGTEKQHYDTKQQADIAITKKLQKDTNVLSSAKKERNKHAIYRKIQCPHRNNVTKSKRVRFL